MSFLKSKQLALTLAAAVIAYLFIDYFFALPSVSQGLTSMLQNMGVVISAFAMVLAAINIFLVHYSKVRNQGKGWIFSGYLLVLFSLVLVLGIVSGTSAESYTWIQQAIFQPLSISAWSIMSVYYIAAIYTVFRARNLDAMIFAIAALIVVLHNAPAVVSVYPIFDDMSNWISNVPGAATFRGTYITVGVGLVALAIRVMLLVEKRFIVGGEEE
jgi:hypothetical protein